MKDADCEFEAISFSLYTPEEIRKLAVKEVKIFTSIEPIFCKGSENGLYDSKLGSFSEREPCRNCNLPFLECNGHFGRIEFPKPVFNPVLFGALFKFIKGICFYCHKLNNIQGLPEILFALGMKEMEQDVKRFNDVEELLSLPYDARVDRALKCMGQSKKDSSKCANCGKMNLIFNKSRKAEILVHMATKVKKAIEEPPSKKAKLDQIWDESCEKLEKTVLNPKFESIYTLNDLYSIFKKEETVIMPDILREHLRYVWINEGYKIKFILPFLKNSSFKMPTDAFFMENMMINPPMNRLPKMMNGDQMAEGTETANMGLIIKSCSALRSIMENRQPTISDEQHFQNIREGLLEVQQRVNTCLDSGIHKNLQLTQPGLRQKIDKKTGLFRQNIMAKRVNYSCRSVISPDPNIGLDEIGVPVIFLKKLTFAENYNEMNKEFLLQCIINGPDVYPGALAYQVKGKNSITLRDGRESVANHVESVWQRGGSITVFRHATDGDALIMNRQPTLHRPSIQTHKIRSILDPNAKTLRMHYSNCKAYNADFDGDEMNGHYMQSIISQTEAKLISNVSNNHSTPKDGSVLAGLIQDHVIAGTRICMRDSFFERHEYYDLVKAGLKDSFVSPMKLLPPAIIIPKRLWTGKQVLSTILINSIPEGNDLPNIVLHEGKKAELWQVSGDDKQFGEFDLLINDGYICTGIFDSVHIGNSQQGFTNDLRQLYGNEIALHILTNFSRGLNRYLIYTGFSANMRDGFLNKDGDEVRVNTSKKLKFLGFASIASVFNLKENSKLNSVVTLMENAQFDKSDDFKDKMVEIDKRFKCLSANTMQKQEMFCMDNLRENFPKNNFSFMLKTGAKGKNDNLKKIAIALGAIEIEGKRTPLTLSGRTLPSFPRYDFNPMSRGFCSSRFTTGLRPQELFLESTAGRDGLVDTAVKTSSSGYLQRCLIKYLEDLTVRADGTVRDNSENIIQFKYGYDGLDVIKSTQLASSNNMEVICRNLAHFKHKLIDESCKNLKINYGNLTESNMTKINRLIENMKKEHINLSDSDTNLLKKLISIKLAHSCSSDGDPVGLIAAQSIGEPSTQMTLNTFHNAGQSEMNVTLGIPRLKEILMTGSEKIKMSFMEIPLLDKSIKTVDFLSRQFSKLRLKDVIKLPLKLEVNNSYKIKFRLKSADEFKHLTNMSVVKVIEKIEQTFLKSLAKTLKKCLDSANIDIKDSNEKEDAALTKNEENDQDDEDNETKTKDKVDKETLSDEEDDDDDGELSDISADESVSEKNDDSSNDEEKENDDGDDHTEVEVDENFEARRKNVLGYSKNFSNYEIDKKKKPSWIRLTIKLFDSKIDLNSLLLNLVQTSFISETRGISKIVISDTKNGSVCRTEGYNNSEIFKYEKLFDLNKFHSNNIIKMSKLYGIEAAVSCIEYEITEVFKPYNIKVSPRHLRLIAEQMTFSGESSAFNRHAMKYHSSQLQRSSFETALDTLNDMLFKANTDKMKSPTANLLVGKLVSNIGGSSMDLLYNRNCHYT